MSQESTAGKFERLSLRSGEIVTVSGIWRADHDHCLNAPEVWMRKHELCPPCPNCGANVHFHLIEEVPHISEDPDFQ